MIDVAWEERILPALSEYTRIPCLSPAFDPDWAERGAIAEAAELLRDWALEQDRGLATEIVQLPGRTPLLLVENGGSGDPILIYGHMDKQPPLGDWRPGLVAVRTGPPGRPPLRPGHGRRRLRTVRRRDGPAGGGRGPWASGDPH